MSDDNNLTNATNNQGGDANQQDDHTDPTTQSDPLANLSLEQIINHPVLGKQVQSWSDKAASKQVASAVEKAKQEATNDTELLHLDKYFNSLSKEQLAEVLATDPDAVDQYARVQTWRKSKSGVPDEEIAARAQVYAYATTISANNSILEKSDLPADVKSRLNPDNYTDQGVAGIVKWTEDIMEALIDHHANKRYQTDLEKRLEADVQKRHAESGSTRRPADASSGRPTPFAGKITKESIKTMTREQIAEHMDEVNKVLAS